jgi:hypothetical protein
MVARWSLLTKGYRILNVALMDDSEVLWIMYKEYCAFLHKPYN